MRVRAWAGRGRGQAARRTKPGEAGCELPWDVAPWDAHVLVGATRALRERELSDRSNGGGAAAAGIMRGLPLRLS